MLVAFREFYIHSVLDAKEFKEWLKNQHGKITAIMYSHTQMNTNTHTNTNTYLRIKLHTSPQTQNLAV